MIGSFWDVFLEKHLICYTIAKYYGYLSIFWDFTKFWVVEGPQGGKMCSTDMVPILTWFSSDMDPKLTRYVSTRMFIGFSEKAALIDYKWFLYVGDTRNTDRQWLWWFRNSLCSHCFKWHVSYTSMKCTYIAFAILCHLNWYETQPNLKCFIFSTTKAHFCHFQPICWTITVAYFLFSLVLSFFWPIYFVVLT